MNGESEKRVNIFVGNIAPIATAGREFAPTQQRAQRQALASGWETTRWPGSPWAGSSLQPFWPKTGLSAVIRATNRPKMIRPAGQASAWVIEPRRKPYLPWPSNWRQGRPLRSKKEQLNNRSRRYFPAKPSSRHLQQQPASPHRTKLWKLAFSFSRCRMP